MAAEKDARRLLHKLSDSVSQPSKPDQALAQRQRLDLAIYKERNLWPGHNYYLVGNSYNVECHILGTESAARREGCIALMLQTRGNPMNCVTLKEAFRFEGFPSVLSRFEHDWLSRLPENTLIGPAYSREGIRDRAAFAVWQPIRKVSEETRPLVHR